MDRVVGLHTSREPGDPCDMARRHVERAINDVAGAIGKHRDAWLARWKSADIRIEGDAAAERTLRFAMYQLLSAANPEDERVSIASAL